MVRAVPSESIAPFTVMFVTVGALVMAALTNPALGALGAAIIGPENEAPLKKSPKKTSVSSIL